LYRVCQQYFAAALEPRRGVLYPQMFGLTDTYKQLVVNQFEAALSTLNICINKCPEIAWNGQVGNLKFCQVTFHMLFFTDFYLGPDAESFRKQPFHQENKDFFRHYEELEDRQQVELYEKRAIKKYLKHCREKAVQVVTGETPETLTGPSGFKRRTCSRAELHVYNMRHIQHHAGQLSLRLRIDHGIEIPWIASGWRSA
jgi:hypothetical protein